MTSLLDIPSDLVSKISYMTSYIDFNLSGSKRLGSDNTSIILSSNIAYAVSNGYSGIRIPLHNNFYTGTGISIRVLKRKLAELQDRYYIKVYSGGFGYNENKRNDLCSCILFTKKIRDLYSNKSHRVYTDVIHIRNRDTKERISNRGLKGIKVKADPIISYNKMMAETVVKKLDGDLPVQQFRRVFTSNMESGGRVYCVDGGVQGFSSSERRELLIDDCKVIELDYRCSHPSIIHELKNREYDVSFIDPYDFHVPEVEFSGASPDIIRDYYKLAVLIALNCNGFKSAEGALRKRFEENNKFHSIGSSFSSQVLNAAYNHNIHLREYFFCDMGLFLQYIDSEIMVKVISKMTANMMPMIPVHDSIVVQEGNMYEAIQIMREAYAEVLEGVKFCHVDLKE